ncbi:MAG: rhomboid family intramembrane serine protease [Bacteroidales bacterium]|nr:rhomboid family intramembrane serine protease [Bacteroidales bacterium]
MNPYGQNNFFDSVRYFFEQKSMLPRLILANILVFVFIQLSGLVLWLFQIGYAPESEGISFITQWLAVPSYPGSLIERPWSLITYMFLHQDFFHILFNMMVLYSGGTIFLQYLSEKQLFQTYIIGGIFGALFFILAFNFFPVFEKANPNAIALGASASVLAIMIAIATYVPQYTVHLIFIGPVRLKYLALIFLVLDVFSIRSSNPGGHIAHLGGALWGFVYILSLKNKFDIYSVFNVFKRKKLKVSYKSQDFGKTERPLTDEAYNAQKNEYAAKVDEILDKISKSGYNSLTSKEKEFLFRMSNRNK